MIANTSIVTFIYIFLSAAQRAYSDRKTFSGMFLEPVGELKDITIIKALSRIKLEIII